MSSTRADRRRQPLGRSARDLRIADACSGGRLHDRECPGGVSPTGHRTSWSSPSASRAAARARGAADPITETGLDLLQCPADAVRAWFLVLVQLDSEGLLRAW